MCGNPQRHDPKGNEIDHGRRVDPSRDDRAVRRAKQAIPGWLGFVEVRRIRERYREPVSGGRIVEPTQGESMVGPWKVTGT